MNVAQIEMILKARYREPWRHYHVWDHILHMLNEFGPLRRMANSESNVEWAIMFHDGIYEPTAKNNVPRSAELALAELEPHIGRSASLEVARLIGLTEDHNPTPNDIDGQIICDCDLSSLGIPWEKFLENSNDIRREYSHVDEQTFRQGRRDFLKSLLRRDRIFATDHTYKRYERPARENISHAIALLT
ncbi:MAG: hypothetical protein V1738_01370 [Patescibacteria group bacterium]